MKTSKKPESICTGMVEETALRDFSLIVNSRGYRPPEQDCYGWAYLAGVITNFFGNGFSCGIDKAEYLDCNNYDSGTYIIKDWLIVGRKFDDCVQDEYSLHDMLTEIDDRMPEHMRLTEDEWARFGDMEKEVLQAREELVYYN
jgi:hypothetical protein